MVDYVDGKHNMTEGIATSIGKSMQRKTLQ